MTQSTKNSSTSPRWLMMFKNLSIGGKLNWGFGLLVIITFIVVWINAVASWQVTDKIDSTTTLHVPVALASAQAQANLLRMQAQIRNYLLLGNLQSIDDYNQTKVALEVNLTELNSLTGLHEDSQEKLEEFDKLYLEWSALPEQLFTLHDNPRENQQAIRLVRTEFRPLSISMLRNIDAMIDLQRKKESTPENLRLLQDMTEFRFSLETLVTNLYAYAFSGDTSFKLGYTTNLSFNATAWHAMRGKQKLLTEEQLAYMETIRINRETALVYPFDLFQIIESEQSYQDLYLFRTELVPRSDRMLQILDELVLEQQYALQNQLSQARYTLTQARLQTLSGGLVALIVAVALAILFKWLIAGPIERLTQTAEYIRMGDLTAQAVVEAQDETGQLAISFNQMTGQLRQTLKETEGLFQAAQAILGANDIETIGQNLITHFISLVQANHMVLLMVDHEKRIVTLSEQYGFSEQEIILDYDELYHGISGIVFETKEPVLSLHAHDGIEPNDTRQRRIDSGIGPVVVVPFVTKGEVIGTITALNQVGQRPFTQHDVDLLMALTTQAAAAIENVRLFQAEQRQRQLSESLRRVSTILNATLDRNVVLDLILDQLGRVIHYDGAAIFLEDETDIVLLRGTALADKFVGARIPINDSNPTVLVYREQKPLYISNTQEDKRWHSWEGGALIRSWVGLPLVMGEHAIGVLTMDNFAVDGYTEEDIETMQDFANQATIAIQNARLYSQAQQANAELTRLNQDKDKFFSIVAHDLKGPFMPLMGNAELLAEMGDILSPSEIKEMGGSIYRSAQATLNLLEALLTWARMQMGRMTFHPENILLSWVAQRTVNILTPTAKSKQLTLTHTINDSLMAYGDENMIDTVIRNLTNNALKFTPPNGEITISASPIRLTDLTLQAAISLKVGITVTDLIEISVTDTGVGITPDDQAKLFRIDMHHSTSGTAQERGTGLGLIMCQEMVERHGGQIWVESELGQGTTVKFTLPAVPKP